MCHENLIILVEFIRFTNYHLQSKTEKKNTFSIKCIEQIEIYTIKNLIDSQIARDYLTANNNNIIVV